MGALGASLALESLGAFGALCPLYPLCALWSLRAVALKALRTGWPLASRFTLRARCAPLAARPAVALPPRAPLGALRAKKADGSLRPRKSFAAGLCDNRGARQSLLAGHALRPWGALRTAW